MAAQVLDVTCIECPKGEAWAVAGIMFHVQRDVGCLPLENCKAAIAGIVESLADSAIDGQAITDLCQLFGKVCAVMHALHVSHKPLMRLHEE